MTKLLILTRTFPYAPAYGGDISYSRGLIGSIAAQAEVTALAASNGAQADGPARRDNVDWVIAGIPKSGRLGSLASGLPNIAWRGKTPAYDAALDQMLAKEWDGIIIDHLGSAHVLAKVLAYKKCHAKTRVAYISHEHEASVRREKYSVYGGNALLRLAMKLDGFKVEATEDRLIRNVDLISLINPADQLLYEKQVRGARYTVTTPGYQGRVVDARTLDAAIPRRVVVLGGRGSRQKQVILERWLETAAPIMQARGVEMAVVGPIDSDFSSSLSSRYESVKFTGFVDDIEYFLTQCRIGIVADFVGGGFKVRLLTYVFNRVPMFSIKTAISGLPTQADKGFAEFADLVSLANGICDRVDDFAYLNDLQGQAFSACSGKFNWEDRGRTLVSDLMAF